MGTATKRRRDWRSVRGSPAMASISGTAVSTPSVSPTHHVIQLVARSGGPITPTANIPATDKLALVRQKSGESRRNSTISRGVSNAAG